MKDLVLYLHGKGGSAEESEHFRPLFSNSEVIGLAYRSDVPWKAGTEISDAVNELQDRYGSITLIANSIGAYFCMCAGIGGQIDRAYFISPIADMERLIRDSMARAGVSEARLEAEGAIAVGFGEDLSWEYLCYVRSHPVKWDVPTEILYGSRDHLTAYETIKAFAKAHGAGLTVMEGGEHWFHTDGQMRFLDAWIREKEAIHMREETK